MPGKEKLGSNNGWYSCRVADGMSSGLFKRFLVITNIVDVTARSLPLQDAVGEAAYICFANVVRSEGGRVWQGFAEKLERRYRNAFMLYGIHGE